MRTDSAISHSEQNLSLRGINGGSYRIAAFPTHLSNDEIPEQVAAHLEKMRAALDAFDVEAEKGGASIDADF